MAVAPGTYLGSLADATAVANLFNTKISNYPIRGENLYFGNHLVQPATWDGTPPTPLGWTKGYTPVLLGGSTYRIRFNLADANKGFDPSIRATLTPSELVTLDTALLRMFPEPVSVTATRLKLSPMLALSDLPGSFPPNTNFPCLIRTPAFIPAPLNAFTYLLYFGGHANEVILVAGYTSLTGSPTVFTTDLTLSRLEAEGGYAHLGGGHLTTPDIYIDLSVPQLRLYYHALAGAPFGHSSGIAFSPDGLAWTFQPGAPQIGGGGYTPRYMRPFQYNGVWYAIEENAFIQRSSDPNGLSDFRRSTNANDFNATIQDIPGGKNPRHCGIRLRSNAQSDYIDVFFSRIGDAPERIMVATADLRIPDWDFWYLSPLGEVLRPQYDFECANLPNLPSQGGKAVTFVNQMRDPMIFEQNMVHTLCGEFGFGISSIT